MLTFVQAKTAAKQAKKDIKRLEQEVKEKTKEIDKMTAKLRKMGSHGAAIAAGGGAGLALAGTGGEGDLSPGCVPFGRTSAVQQERPGWCMRHDVLLVLQRHMSDSCAYLTGRMTGVLASLQDTRTGGKYD